MLYADKKSPVSSYQPSEDVRNLTAQVQKDYNYGEEILNRPWTELNDRSVIDDENRGQMMFNAFVDTSVENPAEAWKWRGTRSRARNKGIAMHANLTGAYLIPLFLAQNDKDETDRDFSEVMQDIVEWMTLPTNSDYQSSFLQIVFGMITNPVTFLGAEYKEVYQTIREKKDKGYETKEILDEVLSGFKCPIYSSTQVLITNPYERNIQKQRCIIKRKWVEKSELEAEYGEHDNWEYVREGWRTVYSFDDNLFHDIKDDDHRTLVAKETYLDRRNDTEVCFAGGVYLGEANVENNPIRHRDNRNAPKYDVTPFGFHHIGEHFFYYKSMMNTLGWDNALYDAMSEVIMNRALLEVEMPIGVSGSDKVDSDVIFPNSVVAFEDKDVRISPLLPGSNMSAGFRALQETDDSISQNSVNEVVGGQLPQATQKAYSVAQAQAASKKLISGVGKSLGASVVQYGDLMKDIAINHITTAQVEELVGGKMKLKYRSFLLENKKMGGRSMNKSIKFDESLIGAEMTPEQIRYENLKLLEESGYPQSKNVLLRVNPEMFAKFKYYTRVDIEEMFSKNQEYWQPIMLNLKQVLANDQYTNQEALTRETMYQFFQSKGDEFVQQAQPVQPGGPAVNPNPIGQAIQGRQATQAANAAVGQ